MVKSCPAGLYLQLRLRRWLGKRSVMGPLKTVAVLKVWLSIFTSPRILGPENEAVFRITVEPLIFTFSKTLKAPPCKK
jgi:hypothetical protein